jgi:hypothetical protein
MAKEESDPKAKKSSSEGWVFKAVGGVFALVMAPVIVAVILKFTGLSDSGPSGAPDKDNEAKKDGTPEKEKPKEPAGPLLAFNGKDLTGLHTYVKNYGKDKDPNQTFTVADGVLHLSGPDGGYLVTDKSFSNYRLSLEYRWGEQTYPPRENKARASYVIVHATGPEGGGLGSKEADYGGYGCFITEGMAGRLSKKQGLLLTFERNLKEDKEGKFPWRFTAGAGKDRQPAEAASWIAQVNYEQFPKGKVWQKEIPKRDVKGYRARGTVEKPVGEWNLLEVTADPFKIEIDLNGTLVNRGLNPSLTRGKVALTYSQAEMFVRRFEIQPLKTD